VNVGTGGVFVGAGTGVGGKGVFVGAGGGICVKVGDCPLGGSVVGIGVLEGFVIVNIGITD
jgi:hypothetical protein